MSDRAVAKRPRGRPSVYRDDIAAEICDRVAHGETLTAVCRDSHMPPRQTVVDWLIQNRQPFSSMYARAKELQIERWADDLLEISDDASNDWMEREGRVELNTEHIQRSRLRTDNRKWLISKLRPEKYGDHVAQRVSAEAPQEPQDAMAILLQIANDPTQPAATRLRAAEACVGYERPRLSSSVNENRNVISIGEELDRARKRIQRGEGPSEGPIIDMEPDDKSG
jgi:hypothetical protein